MKLIQTNKSALLLFLQQKCYCYLSDFFDVHENDIIKMHTNYKTNQNHIEATRLKLGAKASRFTFLFYVNYLAKS